MPTIAICTCTQNFLLDEDGLPFVDYDPSKVKELLTPERLDDYGVLNITDFKSWRVNQKYILWFMGINNALGTLIFQGDTNNHEVPTIVA